jgi:hypothetical protein
MKSVFCGVIALPKVGDELRVCATHKVRGGRSEAAVVIGTPHFWRALPEGEAQGDREVWNYQPDPNVPPIVNVKLTEDESKTAVAAALADSIGKQWSGDSFSCRVRGADLVITTNDDDITFFAMLNGTEAEGRDVLKVEQ